MLHPPGVFFFDYSTLRVEFPQPFAVFKQKKPRALLPEAHWIIQGFGLYLVA
jgi:hypothetical protein